MTKSRKKSEPPIDLPMAEHPGITATDIFPTLEAIWEDFTTLPFFKFYSAETRQVMKYVCCRTASEIIRTVVFSTNMEGNDAIIERLSQEIIAANRELLEIFRDHS